MPFSREAQFAYAALGAFVLMTLLWFVERVRKNANIVDVGWAGAMGLAAIFLAATTPDESSRRWLVGILAAAWALRLAGYLFVNRMIGKPEDGRYVVLRKRFGKRAGLYFLLFFLAQGLLVLICAVPFRVAMGADRPLFDLWDVLGIAVWATSFLGEVIADAQLAGFRADLATRGQVCQRGLWRYSRHPNYFFEWLHWWTYPLLAVGQPWWALTLIGPALMAFFLFRVTGIPATEAHAVASRGEAYRRYQRTTSAFFPWFPRDETSAIDEPRAPV
jgi:steroid 5-alpha reductase family enzyme